MPHAQCPLALEKMKKSQHLPLVMLKFQEIHLKFSAGIHAEAA
ncbi:hypothetical protein [Calothrix sp. NIES-2100]